MLTSIEGTYRNGQIELKEPPAGIHSDTPVIVTFMSSNDIDLREQGINPDQAAELRTAFSTFEDWNDPEMDIYDAYTTKSSV